jgi:hypothetical protein
LELIPIPSREIAGRVDVFRGAMDIELDAEGGVTESALNQADGEIAELVGGKRPDMPLVDVAAAFQPAPRESQEGEQHELKV